MPAGILCWLKIVTKKPRELSVFPGFLTAKLQNCRTAFSPEAQ